MSSFGMGEHREFMREPAYPLYEKRRKVRRGVFEMRLDILRALRYEPKRILRVSMETNQCYLPLRTNIDFLAAKGLIGMSKIPPRARGSRKYGVMVFLTRKGLLVLDRVEAAYDEILDSESHEEDLERSEGMAEGHPLEQASPA